MQYHGCFQASQTDERTGSADRLPQQLRLLTKLGTADAKPRDKTSCFKGTYHLHHVVLIQDRRVYYYAGKERKRETETEID